MNAEERARLQEDLTALADGDRDAFAPVFERVWPLVRDMARRRLPDADAEDAAQRALLRVFARASEFDTGRDALAWVLGVATWEIRSVQRWRWRRREVDAADPAGKPAAEPTPEDAMIRNDLHARLVGVLGALAPADAGALLAHARDERPEGDAFRKRLQRARARLRDAWRARHG